MKIIVLSDSHGAMIYIKKALSMHPDADAAIFLGDGGADFNALKRHFPLVSFLAVRGNNDVGLSLLCDVPISDEITLEGKKIFFTHGHAYSVKRGEESVIAAARARGADILLYGHTHKKRLAYLPGENNEKPLYVVNPGSIGGLGEGFEHSYALISISGDNVLISHGKA